MFQYKPVAKLMIAVSLSVVGLSLAGLLASSSAAAMLPESAINAIVDLAPNAIQSTSAVTDTTVADFRSGTGVCYPAPTAGDDSDGELTLTPTIGITFTGSTLPAGWYTGTYSIDGNVAVGSGVITLAGAYAGTSTVYSPSLTLEFSATFGAAAEHVGLADSTDLSGGSWAIFSTGAGGDQLYARTTATSTPLGTSYLNSGHRYRIEWTNSSVIYSIDGTAVVTDTSAGLINPMRPILSSLNSTNRLVVDWLRLSPYTTTCSFQSRVLNAGQSAHWLNANVVSQQPAGTIIDGFQTRSGRVISPDGTWSAWTPLSGTTIANPNGQYIQYRVQLTTTDAMFAPAVESVALVFTPAGQTIAFNPLPGKTYGALPFTVVATATSGLPVTFTVSGNCSNVGVTVTLTGAGSCAVTAHQVGDATFDPAPNVTQPFAIAKASATITVTSYNVTYDGNAHTATGTATGVKGESLTGLNLGGTTHTNAGDYPSDPWTFLDATGNYTNASGIVLDRIAKATATIAVTPYSVTYNGNAHTATGTATGVNRESLSGLNLSGTTHTNAGDYPSDPWTFLDATGNYTNTSGTVHDRIAKASQMITFDPLPDKIISDPPFVVNASASSTLPVTFTVSGDCSLNVNVITLVQVGSCTVTAHQNGNSNYNAALDVSQSFNIALVTVYLPLIMNHFP